VVQKCIKLSIIFWKKQQKYTQNFASSKQDFFKNKYNNKVRLTRDIQTPVWKITQ